MGVSVRLSLLRRLKRGALTLSPGNHFQLSPPGLRQRGGQGFSASAGAEVSRSTTLVVTDDFSTLLKCKEASGGAQSSPRLKTLIGTPPFHLALQSTAAGSPSKVDTPCRVGYAATLDSGGFEPQTPSAVKLQPM